MNADDPKAENSSTTPTLLWSKPVVEHVPMAHSAEAVLRGHSDLRVDAAQFDIHGRPLTFEARGGRPSTNSIHVQAMQDELNDYLQAQKLAGLIPKQDPTCIDFVAARIKARGWLMGRTTILRKIVAPVHQKIWPE